MFSKLKCLFFTAAVCVTPAAMTADVSGEKAYESASIHTPTCVSCHATGAAGAPVTGNRDDWEDFTTSSVDAAFEAAMEGPGAMPQPDAERIEHTRAAVEYMLEQLD